MLERFHIMARRFASRFRLALLLAACGSIVVIGWILFRSVGTAIEAEKAHHAYGLVVDLVSVHVADTGKWPRSWSDLYHTSPERNGMWEWPNDAAQIEDCVVLDFGTDVDGVAMMDVTSFDAIKPTWPNYGPRSDEIEHLISICRQASEKTLKCPGPGAGESAGESGTGPVLAE